jgi:hypothetical protein
MIGVAMQDVLQQIEILLKEAAECELLSGLAYDAQTRRANRARAAMLRELASEELRHHRTGSASLCSPDQ